MVELIFTILLVLIAYWLIKAEFIDPIKNEKKFKNAVQGAFNGNKSDMYYLSRAFDLPMVYKCKSMKRYAGKHGVLNKDANKVRSLVFEVLQKFDEKTKTFSNINTSTDLETMKNVSLAKELILTTYGNYDNPDEARESLLNLILSHNFSK